MCGTSMFKNLELLCSNIHIWRVIVHNKLIGFAAGIAPCDKTLCQSLLYNSEQTWMHISALEAYNCEAVVLVFVFAPFYSTTLLSCNTEFKVLRSIHTEMLDLKIVWSCDMILNSTPRDLFSFLYTPGQLQWKLGSTLIPHLGSQGVKVSLGKIFVGGIAIGMSVWVHVWMVTAPG